MRSSRERGSTTPAGSMQGHYIFVDEEGEQVSAIIPEFTLLSPLDAGGHA